MGARVLRMIAESGRYTFGLIEQLGIACDAQQRGFLNPVSGQHGAHSHARLIEEWRPFRDDLQLIDGKEGQAGAGLIKDAASIVGQPVGDG